MKKIILPLIFATAVSTHALPQLGIDFQQNNWGFYLAVEVVGFDQPVDHIEIFDNGEFAGSGGNMGGILFQSGGLLPADLQPNYLFGPGLHTLSFEVTDNGNSYLVNNAGFYTVSTPVGGRTEADIIPGRGPFYEPQFIFNGETQSAPDYGSTGAILIAATSIFVSVHRRLR